MTEPLDEIPDVEIDEDGVFKYILLKVRDMECREKIIIRGYDREYHADIDDEVQEKIRQHMKTRVRLTCLGGAFIDRKSAEKSIQIYGQSVGIGNADHNLTLQLLKKAFPDYHIEITIRE